MYWCALAFVEGSSNAWGEAVAHLELSLSQLVDLPAPPAAGSLQRWARIVATAQEPCLLVDAAGRVVAFSPCCGPLFGVDVDAAVGRSLVDGVLVLLDFHLVSAELPSWQVGAIPPLLAISTRGLARGLLRVDAPAGAATFDAVSAPLRESDDVVGSLTFFSPLRH